MKKEELIGKKVRGFKFDAIKYIYGYSDIMDDYIDQIGIIVEYDLDCNAFLVSFEDINFYYPAERIEHHLVVEEENEKTKVVCTNTICQGECGECNYMEVVSKEEPTKEINYNNVSVRICEDNSLIGYYTDDCGITSFGKTFDELLRNLLHAKKAIEESREKLAKEDLEEAKIKANKGVDISFDCKSSNDLKLESLNESCIDYGKIEHDPLDDLPIIGEGVLMEVSDDEKEWHERNVVCKLKNNSFLAVSDNGPAVILWNFARPIPKTKITRKEFEQKFEIID